jgi:hypothetical protein
MFIVDGSYISFNCGRFSLEELGQNWILSEFVDQGRVRRRPKSESCAKFTNPTQRYRQQRWNEMNALGGLVNIL